MTKSYVDAFVQGISWKQPVLAAAAANVTSLSGTTTIDGVNVTAGSRVLLMGQTDATQNGLWVVQSGAWTRPDDFKVGSHQASTSVFVEQGLTLQDNAFTVISDPGSDVVGTNTLMIVQTTGLGEVIVGNGLTKSGNTISAILANNSGLQFTGGAFDAFLNPSGGLAKDANGLKAQLAYLGTINQTLFSDANGIAVTGVPNKFTVAGLSTNATVSAAGLNILTGGTTSLADSQHQHQNVLSAMTVTDYHSCSTALAAGDPVCWGPTGSTLIRADASIDASSRVIGVAAMSAAANTTVAILKRGVGANLSTGLTPGAPIFLNSGGGLTQTAPSGGTLNILRVGYAVNSTAIDINPFFLGRRSA
ncbi:MAG: hypothetical protein EOO38_00005 [Cytophagaceae bacterium]|nr:MAG: hypothetical protein EOO38_00005 [Cytophagaceae bacterium]